MLSEKPSITPLVGDSASPSSSPCGTPPAVTSSKVAPSSSSRQSLSSQAPSSSSRQSLSSQAPSSSSPQVPEGAKQQSSPWSHTSEFVSLGHPDRVADTIAAGIIDAFSQKQHTAIECAISHDIIFLFGESPICSEDWNLLEKEVSHSFKSLCGYSDEHASEYLSSESPAGTSPSGASVCNAPRYEDYHLKLSFTSQSNDIAVGAGPELQNPGWGDQGIFCGYSSSLTQFNNLHPSHWFAMSLTDFLFRNTSSVDIKCLVSTTPITTEPLSSGETVPENYPKFIITKVVVAAPVPNAYSHQSYCDYIRSQVQEWALFLNSHFSSQVPEGAKQTCSILSPAADIIVNGTGSFRLHGPLADSGLTGRKLTIHLYGGVAPIGGGSLVKYPRSADLLLNLLARKLAVTFTSAPLVRERFPNLPVCVNLSAVIGSTRLNSVTVNPAPGFSVPERKKADWDSLVKQFLQFVYSLDLSPKALLNLWGFEDKPQLREIYIKDFFGPRAYRWSSSTELSHTFPLSNPDTPVDWFNWELPFEFVPVL